MNPLSVSIANALLHFLWQGTLIALAVGAINLSIAQRWPRLRYAIALGALLVAAWLPGASIASATWKHLQSHEIQQSFVRAVASTYEIAPTFADEATTDRTRLQRTATRGSVDASVPIEPNERLPMPLADSSSSQLQVPVAWIAQPASSWRSLAPWIVSAYGLGVAIMAARLLLGFTFVIQLQRRMQPIDDPQIEGAFRKVIRQLGLLFPPRLAWSSDIAIPAVVGMFRPIVLLPVSLQSGVPIEQLEAIFAHELAHVRRWDLWLVGLQRLVEAFLFFHPGVWYLSRCVSDAREDCCDDRAVEVSQSPQHYVQSLLSLAERCLSAPSLAASPGTLALNSFSSQPSQLKRRVVRLLDQRPVGRGGYGTAVLLLLIIFLTMNLLPPRASVAQSGASNGVAIDQRLGLLPRELAQRLRGLDWMANVLSTDPKMVGLSSTIDLRETVPLDGVVLDFEGKPVEGAEVWGAAIFVQPPVRERAWTDKEGRFRLNLKVSPQEVHWQVTAFTSGRYGEAEGVSVAMNQDQPLPLASITLREGCDIRGQVRDQLSGDPVAGARVFTEDGRIVSTDSFGGYELLGMPRGAMQFAAIAPGYRRLRGMLDTSGAVVHTLDFSVEPGGLAYGRLVNPAGRQTPKGAFATQNGSGNALVLNAMDSVIQADGWYVYDGLPVDTNIWNLTFSAPGFNSFAKTQFVIQRDALGVPFNGTWSIDTTQSIPDDIQFPNVPVVVDSNRTRQLTGIVLDAQGKPLAGASVRCGDSNHRTANERATTDDRGRFELLRLPTDASYLIVRAKGYQLAFPHVDDSKGELKVQLKPGATVAGTITDAKGRPIANAFVYPSTASPNPRIWNPCMLGELMTQSNSDGTFTLVDLPERCTIDVLHRDFSDQRGIAVELNKLDHQIQLDSYGAVRGRVLDPEGKPVKDFCVLVNFPLIPPPNQQNGGFDANYTRGVYFTDESGRFQISMLPPGVIVRLVARAPGLGEALLDQALVVPIHELSESIEHPLQLTPTNRLTLHVVDAVDQTPLDDVTVTVLDEYLSTDRMVDWGYHPLGCQVLQAVPKSASDPTSGLQLALPQSQATLVVRRTGFARQTIAWRNGETRFDVPMQPEAILEVTIRNQDGTPFERDGYLSVQGSEHIDQIQVGPGGQPSTFQQLAPGGTTINLRSFSGETLASATITLEAGSIKTIEIVARP
jgi:beta-lactamase regulating signal transducer with metallopeptidase domain/protocatechuate 3,4-dioxygenase beta subunit